MNREQAERAMLSSAPSERLAAASFFLATADVADLKLLRDARERESDYYIRSRLDRAIQRLLNPAAAEVEALESIEATETIDPLLLARATEWVGGAILHEMEGKIGLAALYASREVPDYDNSKTRRAVDDVRAVFRGIEQLVIASKTARPREFDLAMLIDDVIESLGCAERLALNGARPQIVVSDRELLFLAITNGLKNAVEATSDSDERFPVVVNWGATDRDAWVSILDQGQGFSGAASLLFEIGATGKKGHSGFGLPVVARVMQAVSGEATLEPQSSGGTKFELRWKRLS